VYPIMLPPLKDRRMDILPIAYHFLKQFCQSMKKTISGFDDEVSRRLTEYNWPGNVRQLRNAVERAVILCDRDRISLGDFPELRELEEIEDLIENIPTTNEELKQVKKQLREKAIRKVEKNFILNALEKYDWNVTRAAKHVGMQRSNFHNLMKKHDIILPRDN
jgi:DNA-binding NtrC family response regulator